MMLGVSVKNYIGLGDKVQFSSLPENYFRAKGEKLIDVSKPWFWDHNPFVIRDPETPPEKIIELWNFPQEYEWPRPRAGVYLCNAEIWAALFGVKLTLNRPRLYRYEHFPFEDRELILFHVQGKSNGLLPKHVIDHVVDKYGRTKCLYQIGPSSDPFVGIPRIETPTYWSLAEVCSRARMFIGVDSGPSWVAASYPDVVVKKVRIKTPDGQKTLQDWVPLEIDAFHSHWDDRLFQIHNTTEDDVGFTSSYKKL